MLPKRQWRETGSEDMDTNFPPNAQGDALAIIRRLINQLIQFSLKLEAARLEVNDDSSVFFSVV
jgi:hypothetical protein